MRTICFTLLAIFSATSLSFAGDAQESHDTIKVTLVGTGGPEFFPNRLGISTLVEANGQHLLFDVGRGTAQNLYLSRINPKNIDKIFLTHLHNDHVEGLPELWITPWFLLGRDHGFEMWGPEGTREMVAGMRAMFGHDLKHRVNQFNLAENLNIDVYPLKDGVIYDQEGVTVTSFPVEHHDGNPAFGYRVDYDGYSVVLSGDTTFHENVITHGKGADLIIHNVIVFSERLSKQPEMKGVLAKLTTPEQAAEIFRRTAPRMAVYTHIVSKDLPVENISEEIVARTRAAGYDGPLRVGEDRMVIEVGDDIIVRAPQPIDHLPMLDSKDQTIP